MAGEVRISVRNLVEFILRSGDIDDRRQGSLENAMQEGSRIHRMIQRRMGAEYQAEVALKYTHGGLCHHRGRPGRRHHRAEWRDHHR